MIQEISQNSNIISQILVQDCIFPDQARNLTDDVPSHVQYYHISSLKIQSTLSRSLLSIVIEVIELEGSSEFEVLKKVVIPVVLLSFNKLNVVPVSHQTK